MGTTIEDINGLTSVHHKPMNLKDFKIGMLFLIWVCCILGIVPKLIPQIANSPLTLSLLNCFSGGIFLSMAFIHIIPESIEAWDEYSTEHNMERPFPLSYVLIFVGYLLVLSVDRVLAGWLLKISGKEKEAHLAHGHGDGGDHEHDHDHHEGHVHHD